MVALDAEGEIVGTRLGRCASVIEDGGKPEISLLKDHLCRGLGLSPEEPILSFCLSLW